jgi:hypothetical protein
MTNELEKKFFDTFGIEPKTHAVWNSTETKWKNFESWEEYPQITDSILLQLICILNSVSVELKSECIKDLKQEILGEMKILLEYAPNEETGEFIKHQVHTLFEEG